MAMVDLEDDSIRRFIALHHRYDQQRRQWRDVALMAFDDEREFQEFLDARNTELQLRQAAGEADPREDVSPCLESPLGCVMNETKQLSASSRGDLTRELS